MRKITVDFEAPKIEINGIVFKMRLSDGEIYRAGRRAVTECVQLNVEDPAAVEKAIKNICGTIDDALGIGAMARIADGRPVNINTALKVLNAIIEDCAGRYSPYVQREYLSGGAHE